VLDLYPTLQKYMELCKFQYLPSVLEGFLHLPVLSSILHFNYVKHDHYEKPSLGQLALKEEAAGKLRVFALVDGISQCCLKPLHEAIFNILKQLPNDATMDQEASVKRCFDKSKQFGKSFCYDLSAATDRLPVLLQSPLVDVLCEGLGPVWKDLLVNRSYRLQVAGSYEEFNYSVGQPMGALSSWGMLALTHHMIVQFAAQRVGFSPLL
jgi:hypothetical protein